MSAEYGMDHIDDKWAWASKRDRRNSDKRNGNHPLIAEQDQPVKINLQTVPDTVLEGTIEAGRRLRAMLEDKRNRVDLNDPATIPSYMTAGQIAETINRAALYLTEYDRRAPERQAREERAQAERAARQFIISSAPLTIEKIHTNGTNGHSTNGHSKNGTNGHHPIPLETPPVSARPLAATRL